MSRRNKYDEHRLKQEVETPVKQCSKRKIHEILDTENDGCATKRRKIVSSVKPCSKRKIREILDFVEHPSKRRKVESKRKPKVILSLDDFNDNGDFIGIATKRRKIEITQKKLADSLKEKKTQSQKKKRRIKYDGKCLEKTFIPYTENIVYEYYDDPNELVERLMLLVSSKSAGNTNHDQEINSIVEELRERSIIQ